MQNSNDLILEAYARLAATEQPGLVRTVADLAYEIGLATRLSDAREWDLGFQIVDRFLAQPWLYQLNRPKEITGLLGSFFPTGIQGPSMLSDHRHRSKALVWIGLHDQFGGRWNQTEECYRLAPPSIESLRLLADLHAYRGRLDLAEVKFQEIFALELPTSDVDRDVTRLLQLKCRIVGGSRNFSWQNVDAAVARLCRINPTYCEYDVPLRFRLMAMTLGTASRMKPQLKTLLDESQRLSGTRTLTQLLRTVAQGAAHFYLDRLLDAQEILQEALRLCRDCPLVQEEQFIHLMLAKTLFALAGTGDVAAAEKHLAAVCGDSHPCIAPFYVEATLLRAEHLRPSYPEQSQKLIAHALDSSNDWRFEAGREKVRRLLAQGTSQGRNGKRRPGRPSIWDGVHEVYFELRNHLNGKVPSQVEMINQALTTFRNRHPSRFDRLESQIQKTYHRTLSEDDLLDEMYERFRRHLAARKT